MCKSNTKNLILLAIVCLSFVCCAANYNEENDSQENDHYDIGTILRAAEAQKRAERYAFGLGRRSYMYPNGGLGIKRLPVYNFGLGKRGNMYENDQDNNVNNDNDDKRSRLRTGGRYGFGLGRR